MTEMIVKTTDFTDLTLVHRGKVRDMYALPGHEDMLLMVATDRISAYDVVMDDAIPGKGEILTRLSLFWFDLLGDIVENHLITADVEAYPAICRPYADQLRGRSMLVHKTRPLAHRVYRQGLYLRLLLERLQKGHQCLRVCPAGRDAGIGQVPRAAFHPVDQGRTGHP